MNDATTVSDLAQEATQRMRLWIERAVIGLELCPFAGRVYQEGRVRMIISTARDLEALLGELLDELALLQRSEPEQIDTTLLVHPEVLQDFDSYNDFLELADAAVQGMGLEGVIQVASFHPHYRFADAPADDISHLSNRSPYPCLHLLREDSIAAAIAGIPDPDRIYQRNIETLRALGAAGWEALGLGVPVPGQID